MVHLYSAGINEAVYDKNYQEKLLGKMRLHKEPHNICFVMKQFEAKVSII